MVTDKKRTADAGAGAGGKNRITVKDVAELANVTAQTVSRVMRNSGYIADETRTRVLNAAHQLGYIPSYAAKALRNGMSQSIAIVFDSLRNSYFSVMIDYLRKAIVEHGLSVQLLFSNDVVITEETYRKAISHGAIGIISFLEGDNGIGRVVDSLGVPLMIFGRSANDEALDYITTNDVQGGQLAAERFVADGCTQFCYVVEGSGMTCAIDRYNGFCEVLAASGYDKSAVELVDITFERENGYTRLDLANPKRGIFCFNDNIAFGILKLMGGIPVEQRAKLIGYDNIQSDLPLPVCITSVGIDKAKHAEFAVVRLLERIADSKLRLAEHQSVALYVGETA